MSAALSALGPPIARGRTAEVYAWQSGYILKLFYEWMSAEAVEREAHIARAVYAAGAPTPAVGESVTLAGRRGLIYARVEGPSLLASLQRAPWRLGKYARLLAEVQAQVRGCTAAGLPNLHARLESRIAAVKELPETLQASLRTRLAALPQGTSVCHGDLHPDNILLTERGPSVIDWIDATQGPPLADVARTSLLLTLGAPLPGTRRRWLLEALRQRFHAVYLAHTFRLMPNVSAADLAAWAPVIAAARLDDGIQDERALLLPRIVHGLEKN